MGRSERRAFWANHIAAWRSGGLSQSRYCEQQGLSLASFGYWSQRLKQGDPSRSATVSFVPAGLTPSRPSDLALVLRGADWRLELPVGTSAGWLAELLKAMR